jgi:hypothetical protein
MSDRREGTPGFDQGDGYEDEGPDGPTSDDFQDIEEVLPDGGLRDDDLDLRSPPTE